MSATEFTPITATEWSDAQKRVRSVLRLSGVAAVLLVGLMAIPADYLGDWSVSGAASPFVISLWMAILTTPMTAELVRRNIKAHRESDAIVALQAKQLADAVRLADTEAIMGGVQARRNRFESRLANALEMAEDESAVIDVIERSFASTIPSSPVEFLLADNSHAHLLRSATASPTGNPPCCSVDSPDHYPAARRAQVQHCEDSDEIDACPKLRGRAEGALSALCVPVSIMGRTVGVIHATGEQHGSFPDDTIQEIETIGKLAGARISLLRVMTETQLQAATDTLTGLLNRRSFEAQATALRRREPIVTIVMADLDHFKTVNDTYGHEIGDRALRVFSRVISESVRSRDLVCRQGGDEFVIALPACPPERAREILNAVNLRLDAAITVASLPKFSVSFGVVEGRNQEDLRDVIARADVALFEAKRAGRNQVVVHDESGAVILQPTGGRAMPQPGRSIAALVGSADVTDEISRDAATPKADAESDQTADA
jgi:diguanylate cyclase (GGDEF)-like protein